MSLERKQSPIAPKINPKIKRARYGMAARPPELFISKPKASVRNMGPDVKSKLIPHRLPKCSTVSAQKGTESSSSLYGGIFYIKNICYFPSVLLEVIFLITLVLLTVPPILLTMYIFSSSLIQRFSSGVSVTIYHHMRHQIKATPPGMKNAQIHPMESIIVPTSGQVATVPKVPPSKEATNFPFSFGGDHRATKQCKAGYKTPYDM